MIDASNLGKKIKEGKNQKTILDIKEEEYIIRVFNNKSVEESFSVAVDYTDIINKNYSLSAGQYFEVIMKYIDIAPQEFDEKMQKISESLDCLFKQSNDLEIQIKEQLVGLKSE